VQIIGQPEAWQAGRPELLGGGHGGQGVFFATDEHGCSRRIAKAATGRTGVDPMGPVGPMRVTAHPSVITDHCPQPPQSLVDGDEGLVVEVFAGGGD